MSETVAALDCGTNTLRLLVAGIDSSGRVHDLDRQVRFVGLGQGVDATGEFAEDAIARAWAAVDEFAPIMEDLDVSRARFVATSAARNARNREVFFSGVRQRLGFEPELISGYEEARLSFAGALSGRRGGHQPVLMMDSGGGSTELVLGSFDGTICQAASLDIGSRRMNERFLHSDPATGEQIARARSYVNEMLDSCDVRLADAATFIAVAGTVTTMAALHLGLKHYDGEQVSACSITSAQLSELAAKLLGMTAEQIIALGPVPVERAKVLAAGALVVSEISKRVPVCMNPSESDILDGVAWSIVRDGRGHRLAD